MHFGIVIAMFIMQRESIEEIVIKEFGSLFAKGERSEGHTLIETDPAGLCKTCDRADKCKLPERQAGTWHCRDFE